MDYFITYNFIIGHHGGKVPVVVEFYAKTMVRIEFNTEAYFGDNMNFWENFNMNILLWYI